MASHRNSPDASTEADAMMCREASTAADASREGVSSIAGMAGMQRTVLLSGRPNEKNAKKQLALVCA